MNTCGNVVFRLGSSTGDDTQRRSLGYLQRVLETNSQSGKRAYPHTRFRSKGCRCLRYWFLSRDATQSAVMRLHVFCPSVTIRYRDHIGWNSSKIISPPNSEKIVMWRFLRNRQLILRLHTIFRALIYLAHHAVIFAIAWLLVWSLTSILSSSGYIDVISFIVPLYLIIRYSRTLSLKAHGTCSR